MDAFSAAMKDPSQAPLRKCFEDSRCVDKPSKF
jgi:hypothetical protein